MKSLLTFALTVMLSMVLVAAAFGGAEGEAAATGGVTLTEPGTFPITEEPSEISLFTYGGAAEGDLPNSWLTAFLQEKTNVSIDFHLTPTERFKEQMNLMIASGEFVDVIIAQGNSLTQLSRPEEMRLIQQGILMSLDDLIETQSVWYKQRLDELPGFREAVTAPDGHIYDFGTVGGCFHCKYGQKMWINQTWLDRLGLEMPTNTDEFYQVMKAFKEQDANGNGDPNDEWPINTAKAGAWVQIDGFLMMPFQFSDVRQSQVRRLYVDDGKIKAAYMQPGYRDGLRYLKRMWDEGLIYPDSFTQDRNQSKRLNQSGEHAIFGAGPGDAPRLLLSGQRTRGALARVLRRAAAGRADGARDALLRLSVQHRHHLPDQPGAAAGSGVPPDRLALLRRGIHRGIVRPGGQELAQPGTG